jgi:hypothetical protein
MTVKRKRVWDVADTAICPGPLFRSPSRRGIAPAILAIGGGSYGVLYGVAGVSAIIGAVAILPVKHVR